MSKVTSELFKSHRRLRKSDLETLGILTKHQDRLVPTIGGILLFGKKKLNLFPDAWIQIGAFAGIDRTQILDSRELTGPLLKELDEALIFLKRFITQEVSITSSRHEVTQEIPGIVLREAVINAIAHADYSQHGAPIRIASYRDRIEIESPGLLPFGLTIDELHRGISKLRNRTIARIMKELGFIEQWGSGIQRMLHACNEAGLNAPQFEEISTHFRVTIWKARIKPSRNDSVNVKILRFLGKTKGSSTAQIAKFIQLSDRATRTRLKALVESGQINEVHINDTDPNKIYILANGINAK